MLTYDDLKAVSDVPERSICPWPKKLYTVRGIRTPTEKVPPFLDGEYLAEVRLSKEGELLNAYQVYFTVMKFL